MGVAKSIKTKIVYSKQGSIYLKRKIKHRNDKVVVRDYWLLTS